jgi:hypothetical protein
MRSYVFPIWGALMFSLGVYAAIYPERIKAIGGASGSWPIWLHRTLAIVLIVFAVFLACCIR